MRWNACVRRAAAAGVALMAVWSLAALAPAQDEVIVESRSGGQNADQYEEVAGAWFDSESKALLARLTPGVGSRFATIAGPGEDIKVAFRPVAPSAGEWEVQVAWGKSGNAGPVTYTVKVGEEETPVELFQAGWGGTMESNSDEWHSLGVFELPEGQPVEIMLDASTVTTNPDPRNLWRVYADAVRIVKPGSEAAATGVYDPSMAAASSSAGTVAPAMSSAAIGPGGERLGESPFLTGQPGVVAAAPAQPASPPPSSDANAPFVTSPVEDESPFVPSDAVPSAPPSMAGVPAWGTDYRQAVTQGIQESRPILLFFHVPDQPQTRQMETAVLSDAGVQAALQGYVLCKIRLGENPQLDAHYKANQAPMLYFLNRSGVSQARAVGVVAAGGLAQALQQYK